MQIRKKIKIILLLCIWLMVVFNIVINLIFIKFKATVSEEETLNNFADRFDKKKPHRNWNNYTEIEVALNKSGLGENGLPADIEEYRGKLYNEYGFDAILSDYISVNRSIPDKRDSACRNLTYAAQLPKASIIIIIYNERLSLLLRTVYSILNRTPKELLTEIILVDDGSTLLEMHEPLDNYLRNYLPPKKSKLKLIRHKKRESIMTARMTGARRVSSKSEVLIFLDSHFEVGYNWLPPLLAPIALDPKTCTCPIIDRINFKNFEYTTNTPWRGYFDFKFNYQMRPLYPHEYKTPAKNFKSYIMMGDAMAICKTFFWDLGGFDEGMTNWGGEQFEMSFKIWMCGGKILDVPCSRMGHLFRDHDTKGNELLYENFNFVDRNYRRILDVWVDDEYKKYFLHRRPSLKNTDSGDLSTRLAIRDRLKCNSFSWMMKHIMPDTLEIFPPLETFHLASGFLRSVFDKKLCMNLANDQSVKLTFCPNKTGSIETDKYWIYTRRGELLILGNTCLEPNIKARKVASYACHLLGGNQKWYYDRKTQWIIKEDEKLCMRANGKEQHIQLAACNIKDLKLKWSFSYMNRTEMNKWNTNLRLKLSKKKKVEK